jgi:hypothetical protein
MILYVHMCILNTIKTSATKSCNEALVLCMIWVYLLNRANNCEMNNDSVARTKKLMAVSVTTAMMMSAAIIVTTTFLSASSSMMIQKASAQTMWPPSASAGRMGPGMMMAPNITGSVNLTTTIGNALASQIKVGLSQAAAAAEKTVGNNSHAVSAHLGGANGYLVYTVLLVDSSYKFHKAIVDVANGQVLSNQQIPMRVGPSSMGMMIDHGMMGGGGGMGPGGW